MQVMIGNAKYQCPCHESVSHNYAALIVGFSVAAAVLLVAFILTVVHRCRRRRKQPANMATKEGQSIPMQHEMANKAHQNMPMDQAMANQEYQSMSMDKKVMDKEYKSTSMDQEMANKKYHSKSMDKKVMDKRYESMTMHKEVSDKGYETLPAKLVDKESMA